MPVHKKRTTSTSEAAKGESSDYRMAEQQEFRQRMRNLAVSAMRALIEEVMREELKQCLGAEGGECTPQRTGYRNGSSTRDVVTKTGRMEDLCVPRDREGAFHSQVFERYKRYEPEGAEALTEMDVAWHQHPQSRQSRRNTDGSSPQFQRGEPPEPNADRTMCAVARAPTSRLTTVLCTWTASILRFGMELKRIRP